MEDMVASILDFPNKKIAIFRALKLGDFLLFVPALRALRQGFPDAAIDYIGLSWNKELAERFHNYIDNFIEFPGYPGLPEQDVVPGKVVEFLVHMQRQEYDLVLQMHGSGQIVNPMVELFGARTLAGFAPKDGYYPNHDFFMEYPEDEPQLTKNLHLLQFLGLTQLDSHVEFPLLDTDYTALEATDGYDAIKNSPYVVLHPGALTAQPWPASHFATVGDACLRRGFKVVLTGTTSEQPIVQAVADKIDGPVVDLSGKTALGPLAALLKGSRLVVANDTGVAHLAEAVDVPSITVFTSTDPKIWAPLDQIRHKIVAGEAAETPDNVIAAAETWLTTEGSDER
jgi:ADP-heptose:LPS heptosyltransferase